MSFDVHVPCNCKEKGLMNVPPFMDKLDVYMGEFKVRNKFSGDKSLKTKFSTWKFCEHDGLAISFSMSGIYGFKKTLDEKYKGKFPDFRTFLPECNHWFTTEYSKEKAISEIEEFNKQENQKFEYRLNQFIALLKKAIEMGEEIYWT